MSKKRKRQPRVIWRGKILRVSVAIQERYLARINAIVDRMINETNTEIEKLFKSDAAKEHFGADTGMVADTVGMDASIASQTRILANALKRKYDTAFGQLAGPASQEMVDKTNRHSFSTTLGSVQDAPNLKDIGSSLTLDMKKLDKSTKQILQNAVNRSADFIKTIPERYLNGVADQLYKSIAGGGGLKQLQEFLSKHNTGISNWVHNTAMDQTRKAYQGLNIGRVKKVGIRKGEWIHSGGSQHPRPLHEAFDGHTFDLDIGAPVGDDDGDNVLPGDEPNCRCSFVPVLTDDDNMQPEAEDDTEDDE